MTAEPSLYWDTTMLAERFFGETKVQQKLESVVDANDCKVSDFTLEEFRATFLRTAVLLHCRLSDNRAIPQTLRDLDSYEFVTRGDGVKARRVLIKLLEGEHNEVDDLLATLARWIEFELVECSVAGMEQPKETSCSRCIKAHATLDPYGVYHFAVSCTLKKPRPCEIEAFWDARQAELRRQSTADSALVEASADNVKRAVHAAKQVIDENKAPRGKRCYVHLGDSVILASAPKGSRVLTSNLKDFEILAQIVGSRQVSNPAKD